MTEMEEVDDCIEAAMALIRELEMIRDKKSILEIQEAKVITDLLIPWGHYFVTDKNTYLSLLIRLFFNI